MESADKTWRRGCMPLNYNTLPGNNRGPFTNCLFASLLGPL